jgi:hypothetical protein
VRAALPSDPSPAAWPASVVREVRGLPRSVAQVHVRLLKVEPDVWRRVLVPHAIALRTLHRVLQVVMGWEDRHLWAVHVGGDGGRWCPVRRQHRPTVLPLGRASSMASASPAAYRRAGPARRTLRVDHVRRMTPFLEHWAGGSPILEREMASTGVTLTRRPLRIGWCMRQGNINHLREAVRLTSMLWGGAFNPILPVDDQDHAKQLANVFRVDALYTVSPDPVVDAFVAANAHIAWPPRLGPLVRSAEEVAPGRRRLILADVAHAAARCRKRWEMGGAAGMGLTAGTLPTWALEDPLSDALLVGYGGYPPDEIGRSFDAVFASAMGGDLRPEIGPSEPLPATMATQLNPLQLTAFGLLPMRGGLRYSGIYVGSVQSFDDLAECWNLGAAGNSLVFYDPAHDDRLRDVTQAYLADRDRTVSDLPESSWDRDLSIWARDPKDLPDHLTTGRRVLLHRVDRIIWNGLNVQPPVMSAMHSNTIGNITTDRQRPTLTFQIDDDQELLPTARFEKQYHVLTVRPHSSRLEPDGFTFAIPNIPELNGYYGRRVLYEREFVRVEPDGIGVLTPAAKGHLTLHALPIGELIEEVFGAFGMRVRPSRAGLIAKRLIQQMGGVQGCRVFKIAGVRRLIRGYNADQSFAHVQALKHIGPGFEAYRDLYIAPRDTAKLEPNDAFLYLLGKGVFRAGLEFVCPSCNLDFWLSLDDAKTWIECEYCGTRFNSTVQLRDQHGWRYRRSGLFGRDNHQEGGVPVALALQRLDTTVSGALDTTLFSTGLDVEPNGADVPRCELDFVFLGHSPDGRVQLGLGEAKGGDEIDGDDVTNIRAVARAFPLARVDAFPVFTKAGDFSEAEIERCIDPAGTYPKRAILFSRRELEPYDLSEVYEQLPVRVRYAHSLADLAEATAVLYGSEKADFAPE